MSHSQPVAQNKTQSSVQSAPAACGKTRLYLHFHTTWGFLQVTLSGLLRETSNPNERIGIIYIRQDSERSVEGGMSCYFSSNKNGKLSLLIIKRLSQGFMFTEEATPERLTQACITRLSHRCLPVGTAVRLLVSWAWGDPTGPLPEQGHPRGSVVVRSSCGQRAGLRSPRWLRW